MVKQFFSPQNLKAISAARRLLREGGFDAVSVHTTLAAAVIRAAALTLSKRPILFSTCHGYLFSETDSTAKRLAYLLPEKLCARVTDVLMVMNEEDRRIAVKHRLSADGTVHSIPGMGVDFPAIPRRPPNSAPRSVHSTVIRRSILSLSMQRNFPDGKTMRCFCAPLRRRGGIVQTPVCFWRGTALCGRTVSVWPGNWASPTVSASPERSTAWGRFTACATPRFPPAGAKGFPSM